MHVYLIHATGTTRYKIGITARTIESRMKELNSSQAAYPLTLITSIKSEDFKAVERHLHEKYKDNRVHGEWFTLSQNQVTELQQYMHIFDTPLNQFKPIFKPKSQPQKSNGRSFVKPIVFKNWLLPLTVALGLVYVCRNVEFFQPRQQTLTHTSTHTVLRRK